ncbi:arsinothricin resistance N-acetyltransferase ArsN1 family A [Gottfriedia acidiceleris]|uniref:Arsinothricin resistance N-acetyltransferase ArsN1 n=1 Tax=Gottfriedia acidiceleris TaxID=371036 RepID=A0ABY4JTK5_9BACI|nr:arsinothricin resistance N-acetyltransferase ArsN1 family A [Gottfriedia acidiceleris]UPM56133.1 arsinothricin resistance N-acetyltransferase ArsN1 [Gottfriedia acidiceleris]
MKDVDIRLANENDLESIQRIYNQGIEDRIATLETEPKDLMYMKEWYGNHQGRFKVIVVENEEAVIGWASLNQYNGRCAYNGVADLSIYISRDYRGKGVGSLLLESLEQLAKENDFHKIVLFTFSFNGLGQGLYRKKGYREVGVFKNQGILDGEFVDVMAMEKIIAQ